MGVMWSLPDIKLGRRADAPWGREVQEGQRGGRGGIEAPKRGDYTIIKPRWSAFFGTELDLILRRLRIETVILTGTTTPIVSAPPAMMPIPLDYNVVVLEDCCSSQTKEIQEDEYRGYGANGRYYYG